MRADWGSSAIIPLHTGLPVYSGQSVTTESALGIPAVGAAIRLVAGMVAQLPLLVVEGKGGARREREDLPVAALLEHPDPDMSPYRWRELLATYVEAFGKVWLRKVRRGRGRAGEVIGLQVVDPRLVSVRSGRLSITANGATTEVAAGDMLLIGGDTSRIEQHRDALGTILARERFEGAFFRNGARPGTILAYPGQVTRAQAEGFRTDWEAAHAGVENAARVAIIGGGATVTTTRTGLDELQVEESRRLAVEEVARIFDVPATLLGAGDSKRSVEEEAAWFLRFGLGPRLCRIESALAADPDLFVAGGARPLFDTSSVTMADARTRATILHSFVQDGVLLVDEARAELLLPPLPDGAGQVPQITPVGGAPTLTLGEPS